MVSCRLFKILILFEYIFVARVKVAAHYEDCIVTASSNGEIKVWTRKLVELSKVNTGCRITCLVITKLMADVKKEEEEESLPVKETVAPRQTKSTVIVEIDQSSDEDEVPAANPKRKKCKKKSDINERPVVAKKKQKVTVEGVHKLKVKSKMKKNKLKNKSK